MAEILIYLPWEGLIYLKPDIGRTRGEKGAREIF